MSEDQPVITYSPITEREMIHVYFTVLIFAIGLVTIIPTILSIIFFISWYISIKNRSVLPLLTSIKVCRIILVLASISFGLIAASVPFSGWYWEEIATFGSISVGILFVVYYLSYFKHILLKHGEWIAKNGLFSSTEKEDPTSKIDIIKGEKFSTYSVADELQKWKEMLDKKVISEEEFNKAKSKLLG